MSEPPVQTGVDDVQATARKTGHQWVDMVLALSAITISVISLFLAINHGKTEERMVAASSWPFLIFQMSEDGAASDLHTVNFRLKNSGVGPARVKSFRMVLDGRPIHDHSELLARCCGLAGVAVDQQIALGLVSQNDALGVIPARDEIDLLTWRDMPGQPSLLKSLKAARSRLRFDVCYCSVLDECWTSNLSPTANPRRVTQCPMRSDG